jgi:cation-dependent mannose-6-phosphate receptor
MLTHPPRSLESYEPVFRGRKLVLNYTGGSLCPSKSSSRSRSLLDRSFSDDDEDDRDKDRGSKKEPERRKTTIISLLCEQSSPVSKTTISFVAAVDECVYFFEGRSPYACGGVEAEVQALGPGGVFGVIILIAVLVYLVGGWVYQRTVMHQRGWRQLPNYALWAGIWGFLSVRNYYQHEDYRG